MVSAATSDDLGPAHGFNGARTHPTLRQLAGLVVCRTVFLVRSIAVAETSDRRARYGDHAALFCSVLSVVERNCRGRRVISALDCLWLAACSARHGKGPAAGGIFRLGHGGLSDG